jgi:signal peptidase I
MMFDRWRRYSYAAQKKERHRIWWILLWVFIFFIIYTSFTSLVFSIRVLENETMQPGLQKGDRFIFSSYRIYSFFPKQDKTGLLRRGNIVLVDKSLGKKQSIFFVALDSVVRFFTAQRFGLGQGEEDQFIKRVIGLPGDEITMINFVIRVKPRGELYSFTEFELWDRPYESKIPAIPALWDTSLPFSGNMEKIILGVDECFVLSDDRSNTNDSRTWGPVPLSLIAGKALFRYWPFTRLGIP